jgi:hypothetical protein
VCVAGYFWLNNTEKRIIDQDDAQAKTQLTATAFEEKAKDSTNFVIQSGEYQIGEDLPNGAVQIKVATTTWQADIKIDGKEFNLKAADTLYYDFGNGQKLVNSGPNKLEINYANKKAIPKNKKINFDKKQTLSSGTHDIKAGKYDVQAIKGSGLVKINNEQIQMGLEFAQLETDYFENLTLDKDTQVTIIGDLEVDLIPVEK